MWNHAAEHNENTSILLQNIEQCGALQPFVTIMQTKKTLITNAVLLRSVEFKGLTLAETPEL